MFPKHNSPSTSPRPHTCHMHSPFHFSWFDLHPLNIRWGVKITKLLVMGFSPVPCYLVRIRPKYLPQQHTLVHPQSTFLRHVKWPSFTPIWNNRQNFCHVVRDMVNVYGEEVLAPRPTPKLEDYPLSAVRDCLFNIFSATLHIWMPFPQPQNKDAPCSGNRDPFMRPRLIMQK